MIVFYTTLGSVDNVCNTSKLVCSDGFYYEDRTGIPGCRPECGEWEEFPRGSVIAFDVFVVFQATTDGKSHSKGKSCVLLVPLS